MIRYDTVQHVAESIIIQQSNKTSRQPDAAILRTLHLDISAVLTVTAIGLMKIGFTSVRLRKFHSLRTGKRYIAMILGLGCTALNCA